LDLDLHRELRELLLEFCLLKLAAAVSLSLLPEFARGVGHTFEKASKKPKSAGAISR